MVYGGLVALIMDRRREPRGQPKLAVNASAVSIFYVDGGDKTW
jgi:hypothetical protein